jgi:hypothetical protein
MAILRTEVARELAQIARRAPSYRPELAGILVWVDEQGVVGRAVATDARHLVLWRRAYPTDPEQMTQLWIATGDLYRLGGYPPEITVDGQSDMVASYPSIEKALPSEPASATVMVELQLLRSLLARLAALCKWRARVRIDIVSETLPVRISLWDDQQQITAAIAPVVPAGSRKD